jgi:hypothetical protein
MTRHAAAAALAVLLTPSWLYAQAATTTQFTVTVSSAAVHKAPSTASPVVGRAARGMVIDVTRDVGSWVKVAWPEAEDGIGYVHQTMGRLAQRAPREERIATALAPSLTTAPMPASSPQGAPAPVPLESPASAHTRMTYVPPPTHNIGFGARTGTMREFGVTTRLWSFGKLGVQVEAMRWTETNDQTAERVTTAEFAPGAIYMLRDYVTDSVWLRPYVGGALAIRRATFRVAPDDPSSVSDSSLGYRAFGGVELTFPSVPRLAFSADLGYLEADAPFPGFEPGGMRVSIGAHWYVK